MEYPKIQSLFKREGHDFQKTGIRPKKSKLLIGEYSIPDFGLIKQWDVFEKIDGTNIRITYTNDEKGHAVKFDGRSSNSQIPTQLLHYLTETFTLHRLKLVLKDTPKAILFGEGYGCKIQGAGGNYRKDIAFIGFDVLIDRWWLEMENAKEIFHSLHVSFVPMIGKMTTQEVVDYISGQPKSLIAENRDYVMEGVVCRTDPMLFLRNGEMLKFKLRCEDMEGVNG